MRFYEVLTEMKIKLLQSFLNKTQVKLKTQKTEVNLQMTLNMKFKDVFKVIEWSASQSPTTLV